MDNNFQNFDYVRRVIGSCKTIGQYKNAVIWSTEWALRLHRKEPSYKSTDLFAALNFILFEKLIELQVQKAVKNGRM